MTTDRFISIEHCTEMTKAGIRAWANVIPEITGLTWIESNDLAKLDIVFCDSGNLEAARVFATGSRAVLVVWGLIPNLHVSVLRVPMPVSPDGLKKLITIIEQRSSWGMWRLRALEKYDVPASAD